MLAPANTRHWPMAAPPPAYDAPYHATHAAPLPPAPEFGHGHDSGSVYAHPHAAPVYAHQQAGHGGGYGGGYGAPPPGSPYGAPAPYAAGSGQGAPGRGEYVKNPLCCIPCITPFRCVAYMPLCCCVHYGHRFELLERVGERYTWLGGLADEQCCCCLKPIAAMMEMCPGCGMCCELACCHICSIETNREYLVRHYGLRLRCCLDCGCSGSGGGGSGGGGGGGGDNDCAPLVLLIYLILATGCSACFAAQVQTELNHQDRVQRRRKSSRM